MKILLTGAGGFIGSALLPLLLQYGHDVTVLTRPDTMKPIATVPGNDPASCEILTAEPDGWATAVGSRSFDVCMHLAWIATPGVYLNSPENDLFADCSVALAERLFANGTPHFIGTGTGIEYAPDQEKSCHETMTPLAPHSVYGRAKARTYHELAGLAQKYQTGATWARVFYPYGLGEHPARTASSFLRSLAAGHALQLKTSSSRKDFIEISDLAGALMHLIPGPPQGAVNIGTGLATSIRELALLACDLTDADPALVQEVNPPGYDPYRCHVADIAKVRAAGWSPVMSLNGGLARLLDSL